MEPLKVWEIYVPCVRNNGRPIRTKCHREWDKQVRKIAGGLTIYRPVIGQWVNPDDFVFLERMIPVRIACTNEQMEQIAALTLKFYEQEAVMYYVVSEKVIFKYA